MKQLKESLLSKTKDKIDKTTTVLSNMSYLGGQYTWSPRSSGYGEPDMSIISIRNLKKITKDMEWKNPEHEKMFNDPRSKWGKKIPLLIKYLDNLNLLDLGIDDDVHTIYAEQKMKYRKILKDKFIEDGIFNSPNDITIFLFGPKSYDPEGFTINMHRKGTYKTIWFFFKKNENV